MADITYVLVADGGEARIIKVEKNGTWHDAQEIERYENENKKDKESYSDRGGNAFGSGNSGVHTMEKSVKPQQESETKFAKFLIEKLEKLYHKGVFQNLIIVAPPRMLGDIRKFMSKELNSSVLNEINKDLTKKSVKEVQESL